MYTFSDTEKDQQDTTFMYAFPYWDMDKGMIMEIPELLMEVNVTGIMGKMIVRATILCGGLTYPSNLVFNITQYAYSIRDV